MSLNAEALLARLPKTRGALEPMRPLAPLTWLRVGGPAEVLFSPADEADLAAFLAQTPADIPITPLGLGSNVIMRDGGAPGVVVRLGKSFGGFEAQGACLRLGAGVADAAAAKAAAATGIAGMEFLRGVPGAIGGAVRMNAGCYGAYMADVVDSVRAVERSGHVIELRGDELGFAYRSTAPRGLIYTAAVLKGAPGDPDKIAAAIADLVSKRAAAQPVKDRTAGSTFRNPSGASSTGAAGDTHELKAWKLIEDAGCRGLRLGGAVMNHKHANFLTNAGGATAADLEGLGEEVRARVKAHSGVELIWEIERIGLPK